MLNYVFGGGAAKRQRGYGPSRSRLYDNRGYHVLIERAEAKGGTLLLTADLRLYGTSGSMTGRAS